MKNENKMKLNFAFKKILYWGKDAFFCGIYVVSNYLHAFIFLLFTHTNLNRNFIPNDNS